MKKTKAVRLISNIVYGIGSAVVLALIALGLFGPNEAPFPMAMISATYRELACVWLAFGVVPMLLACMAVYKFNDIKNSAHKKRSFIFIFLPGFLCAACALFVIGVILVGFFNFFSA